MLAAVFSTAVVLGVQGGSVLDAGQTPSVVQSDSGWNAVARAATQADSGWNAVTAAVGSDSGWNAHPADADA
ncbi:hypothetical protein AAW14_11675 [Streptomyces hygroscopicus]|nr:hypothetical protein [Streptomyces hygroscopicus]